MHNFELVVIGAHFGVWLKDEISKILDKNILLVEPVPYNYKILQKEYSNSQNIKICTNSKRFKVEDKDIEIIDVDFITFNNLIEKYSIKSINKLQVDVEGAEYKILNSIDFSKIEIKKIIFESKHFDGTFKEGEKLKEFKNKLVIAGYKLNQLDQENILAEK